MWNDQVKAAVKRKEDVLKEVLELEMKMQWKVFGSLQRENEKC